LGLILIGAAGCVAPPAKPLPVCPGRASAEEALEALRARANQGVPFEATGQCRITYHVPDEKGAKKQGVSLSHVWFQPPSDIYIQGGIAADPKAIVVGSNAEEFWMAMAPKEVSSYYWGRWTDAENAEGMLINPTVVLEAFGFLGHDDPNAVWTFAKSGPYDVLTRLNSAGLPARRLYVYTCDYLVYKMEYFGPDGLVAAIAELDDYQPVTEGFQVPTKIRVVSIDRQGREDALDISLRSLKQRTFAEAQRKAFVRRPGDISKFEHVYRLVSGHWIGD
jgi:hypothetical protein